MARDSRHQRRRLLHAAVGVLLAATTLGVAIDGTGHAGKPLPSLAWSRAEIRPGQTVGLVLRNYSGTTLGGVCTSVDGELVVCAPIVEVPTARRTYQDLYDLVGTATVTLELYDWSLVSLVGADYVLAGEPWSTTTLRITDRPTTPRVAALTRDEGRVWVTARPPHHDGGSPIISYQARCTDGETTWTSFVGPSTTVRVGRLPTGVLVQCSVRALNGNGWSAWSADRRLTTSNRPPLPPDAPAVAAVTPGVRQVVVTVKPPERRHGSVIERFEVKCRSGQTRRFSDPSHQRVQIIERLTARQRWLCSARARNSEGWSAWSAPTIVNGVTDN